MDFSLKQALGVVVVIAIAALVILTAVRLTKDNNTNAKNQSDSLWEKANDQWDVTDGGIGGN